MPKPATLIQNERIVSYVFAPGVRESERRSPGSRSGRTGSSCRRARELPDGVKVSGYVSDSHRLLAVGRQRGVLHTVGAVVVLGSDDEERQGQREHGEARQ